MIVVKFGGSILKDARGLERLYLEVTRLEQPLLIVVSAFADVTNRLEVMAKTGLQSRDEARSMLEQLFADHRLIASEVLEPNVLQTWEDEVAPWKVRLDEVLEGLSIVGELSDRTLDYVVHFGEKLSSSIVTPLLASRAGATLHLSSVDLLVTDEHHRYARVRRDASRNLVVEKVGTAIAEGAVYIVTEGYIARGRHGEITTMGRESSDYSAALFGEFLGAEEVRIYTGAAGILSADPLVVPDAVTIPEMTYDMARRIGVLGTKVIHPRTVRPAERGGIPLIFLDLDGSRTVISKESTGFAICLPMLDPVSLIRFRLPQTDTPVDRLVNEVERRVPVVRMLRNGRDLFLVTAEPISDFTMPQPTDRSEEEEPISYEIHRVGLVSIVREIGIGPKEIVSIFESVQEASVEGVWLDPGDRALSILVPTGTVEQEVINLHRHLIRSEPVQ